MGPRKTENDEDLKEESWEIFKGQAQTNATRIPKNCFCIHIIITLYDFTCFCFVHRLGQRPVSTKNDETNSCTNIEYNVTKPMNHEHRLCQPKKKWRPINQQILPNPPNQWNETY